MLLLFTKDRIIGHSERGAAAPRDLRDFTLSDSTAYRGPMPPPRHPILRTGRQIALARKPAGLTQSKLADVAGLNLRTVKRIEAMGELTCTAYTLRLIEYALRAYDVELIGDPPRTRHRRTGATWFLSGPSAGLPAAPKRRKASI